MNWEIIIPVISLLIGWSLREVSDLIKKYKSRKEEVNKALADLLEINASLTRYKKVLKAFQAQLEQDESQLNPVREVILEADILDEISNNFKNTVENISTFDPILAYQLRSNVNIGVTLQKVTNVSNKSDRTGRKVLTQIESEFIKSAKKGLNDAILILASKSNANKKEIEQILQSKPLSNDSKAILDKVRNAYDE